MSPSSRPIRVRAVLWDVFGTLVAARAAEPIELDRSNGVEAMRAAVVAAGLPEPDEAAANDLLRRLQDQIRDARAEGRRRGEAFPEPDVRAAWRKVLEAASATPPNDAQVECAADTWERLTNPVCPMPGAHDALRRLAQAGFALGIASNAQFDTPARLAALFADAAPWDEDLCVWSWQIGVAKPSPAFYDAVVRRLAARGWTPADALVVGNSPRNDIASAARAGLRTVWFRDPDAPTPDPATERIGRAADRVIASLSQLFHIIGRAV